MCGCNVQQEVKMITDSNVTSKPDVRHIKKLWALNTPQSLKELITYIEPLAYAEDPEMQAWLGRAYKDGKGVEKNLVYAAHWFRRSSNHGTSWAKWNLFDTLWAIGSDAALQEMVDLAEPLAESGNGEMQARLGKAYLLGKGVDKDLDKAAYWMKSAITNGTEWVIPFYVKVLWAIGSDAALQEMVDLAEPLAESGNGEVQAILGQAYWMGKGVDKDLDKAAYWTRLASKNKIRWSSWNLFNILWDMGLSESIDEIQKIELPIVNTLDSICETKKWVDLTINHSMDKEINNKIVLFDVSHYLLLNEMILIRMVLHPDCYAILQLSRVSGNESLINRLRKLKIFDMVLEYEPFAYTGLEKRDVTCEAINRYFSSMYRCSHLDCTKFVKIYTGSDIIQNFGTFLHIMKIPFTVVEAVPKQFLIKTRENSALKNKWISYTYNELQKETGVINGQGPYVQSVVLNKLDNPQFADIPHILFNESEWYSKLSNNDKKTLSKINLDNVNGKNVLLMNSIGRSLSASKLCDKELPILYRTLIDFYMPNEKSKILVKMHPASHYHGPELLDNYRLLNRDPIDFIKYTKDIMNIAITIDSTSLYKLIESNKVRNGIFAGCDYYTYFKKLPELCCIISMLKAIGINKINQTYYPKDFFDNYCKTQGVITDSNSKVCIRDHLDSTYPLCIFFNNTKDSQNIVKFYCSMSNEDDNELLHCFSDTYIFVYSSDNTMLKKIQSYSNSVKLKQLKTKLIFQPVKQ